MYDGVYIYDVYIYYVYRISGAANELLCAVFLQLSLPLL